MAARSPVLLGRAAASGSKRAQRRATNLFRVEPSGPASFKPHTGIAATLLPRIGKRPQAFTNQEYTK